MGKEENGNIRLVHAECGLNRKKAWQESNPDVVIEEGDYCKLGIPDGKQVEHMWILVTNIAGRKLKGILHNTPVVIANCEWGDTVEFDYEDIEDLLNQ